MTSSIAGWRAPMRHRVGDPTSSASSPSRGEAAAIDLHGAEALLAYIPSDRTLLENAILFQFSPLHPCARRAHRTTNPSRRRAVSRRVRAAHAGDLASYGWERTGGRFVGIFFQMRRAFFFIERGLTGKCPSMRALRESLWNNVFTYDIRVYERYLSARMEDFSTIFLGETGSAKAPRRRPSVVRLSSLSTSPRTGSRRASRAPSSR